MRLEERIKLYNSIERGRNQIVLENGGFGIRNKETNAIVEFRSFGKVWTKRKLNLYIKKELLKGYELK